MNGILDLAAVQAAVRAVTHKYGSRVAAAQRLGVGYQTVNNWLAGYRTPTYIHAVRLARLADIDMEDLYTKDVAA